MVRLEEIAQLLTGSRTSCSKLHVVKHATKSARLFVGLQNMV